MEIKRYSTNEAYAVLPYGAIVVRSSEFDRVTAERDALQQRLSIADEELDRLRNQPAEQNQGEPVALVRVIDGEPMLYSWFGLKRLPAGRHQLYTHADPGEIEQLRAELKTQTLRADAAVGDANEAERKLAERDSLLARVVNSGALSSEQHEELEADCCAAVDVVQQIKRQEFREHLDKCAAPAEFKDSLKYFMKRTAQLNQQLAERNALLRDVQRAMREYEQGCDPFPPFHHNQLMERIDTALSTSAKPEVKP